MPRSRVPAPLLFQRLQQFRMRGDAGAAADQLDRRAFEHVDVPADPAQERRGEQARHRAADDDGAPGGGARDGMGWPGLDALEMIAVRLAQPAVGSIEHAAG